jgi:pimeloyl-ACP methyl ester carboxylesterase
MPTVEHDGATLRYATEGEGPTVAFCSDAGLGVWEWSYLLGALPGTVETLVWEYRGTGDSDDPDGSYPVSDIVADLDAVLADHGARSVHLVGAGLGGQVAVEYARRHGRPDTLALFGTPAEPDDLDGGTLDRLRSAGRDPAALTDSMDALLSPDALAHDEEVSRMVEWRQADDASEAGWDAQAEAFRSHAIAEPYEVTTPALVAHGVADALVDPAAGERLADELPRGRHQPVEGGHCCFVESAGAVADELVAWVDSET